MQAGSLYIVRSDPALHFTSALAQNAEEFEALNLPAAVGAGKISRAVVRAITVLSYDNNAWEFNLWTKRFAVGGDGYVAGDVTQDAFRGRISLAAAAGLQIGAAGLYRYYADGLGIVYEDESQVTEQFNQGRLFMSLVNRSAGAKTAYSNPGLGGFQVSLLMEPTQGW